MFLQSLFSKSNLTIQLDSYSIMQNRQEPNCQIKQMIQVQKLYLIELDKWCKDDGDVVAYFEVFSERLAEALEMCISNDDRIIPAIHKLLKSYDYLEFTNRQEHQSAFKKKLKKVVELLGEFQFISKRYCHDLINAMDAKYLREKFTLFIDTLQTTQRTQKVATLQVTEIQRTWRKIVQKNFQQIWAYLANRKIYDEIIPKLYDACLPCIKQYSIQRIQEISAYNDANTKFLRESKYISPTIFDLFPPVNNSKLNYDYNQIISKYIAQRSLFLNREKLQLAYQQIKDIINTVKSGTPFGASLTYELYGSMRTGFAVISESDGDIHINPISCLSMTRQEKIQYLVEIYNALRNNSLGKLEFSSIQPFTSDRIRVPFIKLKFENHFNFNRNSNTVLKFIDVIVSSPTGVQNSKVLQLYSKSQYIIKFGNLIKLWAKRKTLINKKMPTEGLSSYGVILMVIFYLIKTNQAPYVIQTPNGYRLEKNLLGEKDWKPLLDNFKGFLEFYKIKGPFFAENMVVCLMQNPNLSLKYDKYLVNMFDFIDKSNPGRISKSYSEKFFNAVCRTYNLLLTHAHMNEIMKYEE